MQMKHLLNLIGGKILCSACLLLLCCVGQVGAQLPVFEWAKRMGGGAYTNLSASTVDAGGNTYITGEFKGAGDFGSTNLTASGASDIHISKLDAAGNFLWTKQIGGGSAAVIYSHSIAIDNSGNIYITGLFAHTVDFDPGTAVYNLTANPVSNGSTIGSTDIFVCKLDNNGAFIWAKQIGGTDGSSYGQGTSIAVDNSGDVFVSGTFAGVIDFNPASGPTDTFYLDAGAPYSSDAYLLKLSTTGSFLWAHNLTASGRVTYPPVVCTDAAGHVYVSGTFKGTVDLDPGTGSYTVTANPSNVSADDMFLSKFTSSGTLVFAKHLATTNSTGVFTGIVPKKIFADVSGNIYTTGSLGGAGDFDPGPASYMLQSTGHYQPFISKLDAAGNFLWAKQITITGQISSAGGQGLVVSDSGGVYITGNFNGIGDFDPGSGVYNITANGDGDIFILKLNTSGDFGWAVGIGDNTQDIGGSINLAPGNALIVSGNFFGTVDFDPGPGVSNLTASANSNNNFVLKLSDTSACTPSRSTITATGCDSLAFFGNTYRQTGIYEYIFTFEIGCDSIVTLDLTILNPNLQLTETTCGSSYTLNGQTYTASGQYVQFYLTGGVCDSMVVLDLTIIGIPEPVITVDGYVLGTTASYDTYQWLRNGTAIPGATDSSYTVTENDGYAVAVLDMSSGCRDTSVMYVVTNVGITTTHEDVLSIYPNPMQDMLYIRSAQPVNASLYSADGRRVLYVQETRKLSLHGITGGVYLLHVTDREGRLLKQEKVVKE